jgi:pimeloyl-ACP methyl ester carboxylesterase
MAKLKQRADADAVRLRRMYIDCRHGQMHLTTAYPPSGGFDERTPLLFLHSEGGTGADFNRCAVVLGSDRSVYAPDLPGSGASDSGEGRATVAGDAGAMADLVEQLRLREVDVIGIGRGAGVAFELAAARPDRVRRLIATGQPPSAASSKPLLQIDTDAPGLAQDPVEPLIEAIRDFLDRG